MSARQIAGKGSNLNEVKESTPTTDQTLSSAYNRNGSV